MKKFQPSVRTFFANHHAFGAIESATRVHNTNSFSTGPAFDTGTKKE
ncbi:hypothetical protein [Xanthomonas vesicatoria]|nr:hypothetical protein [Xanthomonas vesicatoria]MCC8558518.1 hypothetical protein [Xanthomonas vesicatoria]MCC8598635.1 hypothetical protein [Xanthomonas vesicatoria]MCC8599351.1 hypothetical protein [Xanthomonas vesicatoria]MCC8607441.1 hypothetical protein [Xanthomonas vesicatoria]MCC8608574.1 hypothetical protein [Xanthomonas vesicatoria]